MATKKVFIACPLGAEDSPERLRSDRLLKFVIQPVVKDLIGDSPEEAIVRSDRIGEPGRITTQILRELVQSDAVIADLTETNPNVMYEVGIRQALLRPLILMAQKGQKLPFDLTDLRTVFYELGLEQVESAKAELKSHLQRALEGAVSPFDEALFVAARSSAQTADSVVSRDLLAVLEVCQGILRETQETKDLVSTVGSIALEIRGNKEEQDRLRQETASQQMGLLLMNQFFQNPDSVEKLLPVIEKFAEFGVAQKKIEAETEKRGRRRG